MRPQVLVYGNRKEPDTQYPFLTLAEKEEVFLKLFKYLKNTWKVYDAGSMSTTQRKLYVAAKNGIGSAAIKLLTARKTYEYEVWHIENVPAKTEDRVSTPVVVKPHWDDVKEVRTRREGNYIPQVTLKLANNKEYVFLLVPHMTTCKDWDDLNAASHFITDALSTEWKGEMHNGEGLKKALGLINELRVSLHYARYPETAPARMSPDKVFQRVSERAESLISEYSNTPIEKLVTKKRTPTNLEESNEAFAEAMRCIGSLAYYLRKAGKEQEVAEVLKSHKIPEEAVR
jgi:hypothetical protein